MSFRISLEKITFQIGRMKNKLVVKDPDVDITTFGIKLVTLLVSTIQNNIWLRHTILTRQVHCKVSLCTHLRLGKLCCYLWWYINTLLARMCTMTVTHTPVMLPFSITCIPSLEMNCHMKQRETGSQVLETGEEDLIAIICDSLRSQD